MAEKTEKIRVEIVKSKWRTGANGPQQTGRGSTALCNREGFLCCLGFICQEAGVPEVHLQRGAPESLPDDVATRLVPSLVKKSNYFVGTANSGISKAAIAINDEPLTTLDEKIAALTTLFADSPYELVFVD